MKQFVKILDSKKGFSFLGALFISILGFVILCLSGCATTPDIVVDRQNHYDSSTPKQYKANNSGFLFFDGDIGIITPNKKADYDSLVESYRLQFKDEFKRTINIGDGIAAYKDVYGNALYSIKLDSLKDFMILCEWRREKRSSDSIWMKAQNSLGVK